MKLLEAKQKLRDAGYRLHKLNEDCGFSGGSWRRPPKPSADSFWIDTCGGGHWANKQEIRKKKYYDTREGVLGKQLSSIKTQYDKLSKEYDIYYDNKRNNIWSKIEGKLNSELDYVKTSLPDGYELQDITPFDFNRWGAESVATISNGEYTFYVKFEVVTYSDGYTNVTITAPKGQRIPGGSNAIKEKITYALKNVISSLNNIANKWSDLVHDDSEDDEFMTSYRKRQGELGSQQRKLIDDYDEAEGWDSHHEDYKVNLTPTGKLKKKLQRESYIR